MNLQSEVARGVKWVAGAKLGSQLITWGITIYVMRLLEPSDYGLLAMAVVALGLLLTFAEAGLGPALVQRKDVSEEQFRQALGFTWLFNLLLFALSNAAAPSLAAFYREPRLQALVHVLSLQFLLLPLIVLPDVQLQRRLDFRKRSMAELSGALASSLATLGLATAGAGVWALAAGPLAGLLGRALVLNLSAPGYWRPLWPGRGMGAVLGMGGSMAATRLLWFCYGQADMLIVGRMLGEQLLGLYSVSMDLASLPMQRIMSIMNQALYPVMSRAQHDLPAIRAGALQVLGYVGLLAFPMMWGMASVAPELVHVVLGPSWEGAVMPLQVLCLVMPFRALAQLLPTVTDALGKPNVGLNNVMLCCVVMPPAFYFGSRWGIRGIALAWLLAYPLVLVLNVRCMLKAIGVSAAEVARRAGPAVLCAALMFGVVTVLRSSLEDQPRAWALVAEVLTGVLAYGLASLLLNRALVAEVRGFLRPHALT